MNYKNIFIAMNLALCLSCPVQATAMDMPQLAKDNGCADCHAIDKRVVGPSWLDVSRKYKGVTKYELRGKEYSLEEGLIKKVSKGGTGNWGELGMPPNDSNGSKQDTIKALVQFVLGLSK